jgi:hypothetical protein
MASISHRNSGGSAQILFNRIEFSYRTCVRAAVVGDHRINLPNALRRAISRRRLTANPMGFTLENCNAHGEIGAAIGHTASVMWPFAYRIWVGNKLEQS